MTSAPASGDYYASVTHELTTPDAPLGVRITDDFLVWDPVLNADGYRIYVDEEAVAHVYVTALQLFALNLPYGTFEVSVRAIVEGYDSESSEPLELVVEVVPSTLHDLGDWTLEEYAIWNTRVSASEARLNVVWNFRNDSISIPATRDLRDRVWPVHNELLDIILSGPAVGSPPAGTLAELSLLLAENLDVIEELIFDIEEFFHNFTDDDNINPGTWTQAQLSDWHNQAVQNSGRISFAFNLWNELPNTSERDSFTSRLYDLTTEFNDLSGLGPLGVAPPSDTFEVLFPRLLENYDDISELIEDIEEFIADLEEDEDDDDENGDDEDEDDDPVTDYQRAVVSARNFLGAAPLSRAALIRQLTSSTSGFTQAQAEYAAGVMDGETNWNANAVASGRAFLEVSPLSRAALIRQLTSDITGFTQPQADYAIGAIDNDTDWNAVAVRSARGFLEVSPLSRAALIRQLMSDVTGFTQAQANHAAGVVDNDTDWNALAVRSGRGFLEVSPLSRAALIRQLSSDIVGFTLPQTNHAVGVLDNETDWNANAVQAGRNLLEATPTMSRNALISQLTSTAIGFTQAQADHAARIIFGGVDPSELTSSSAPTQASTVATTTATTAPPSKPDHPQSAPPQTSDETNIIVWVVLIGLSTSGAMLLSARKKMSENSE